MYKERYNLKECAVVLGNIQNLNNKKYVLRIPPPPKVRTVKKLKLTLKRKVSEKKKSFKNTKSKCHLCSEKFETTIEMYAHLVKVHVDTNKKTEDDDGIITTNNKMFCPICVRSFNSQSTLNAHLIQHHNEETKITTKLKFRCHICKEKFVELADLRQHKQNQHDLPKAITEKNETLLNVAKTKKCYLCSTCDERFEKFEDFARHNKQKHDMYTGPPAETLEIESDEATPPPVTTTVVTPAQPPVVATTAETKVVPQTNPAFLLATSDKGHWYLLSPAGMGKPHITAQPLVQSSSLVAKDTITTPVVNSPSLLVTKKDAGPVVMRPLQVRKNMTAPTASTSGGVNKRSDVIAVASNTGTSGVKTKVTGPVVVGTGDGVKSRDAPAMIVGTSGGIVKRKTTGTGDGAVKSRDLGTGDGIIKLGEIGPVVVETNDTVAKTSSDGIIKCRDLRVKTSDDPVKITNTWSVATETNDSIVKKEDTAFVMTGTSDGVTPVNIGTSEPVEPLAVQDNNLDIMAIGDGVVLIPTKPLVATNSPEGGTTTATLPPPEKTIACGICFKEFSSRKLYQTHLIEHEVYCSICSNKFNSINDLTQHVETHNKPKPVPTTSSNPNNANTKVKCSYCPKIFINKKFLARHLQLTHQKTTCYVCYMEFPPEQLSKHFALAHRKKKGDVNKQPQNDGTVNNSDNSYAEQTDTNKEKPKIFIKDLKDLMSNTAKQEKAADKKKPVSCADCGGTFKTADLLLDHMRQSRFKKCTQCNYFTCGVLPLNRHYDSDHRIWVYQCTCGISFDKRSDFEVHLVQVHEHSNELDGDGKIKISFFTTPVMCGLCGVVFSNFRLLKLHLQTQHGDVMKVETTKL